MDRFRGSTIQRLLHGLANPKWNHGREKQNRRLCPSVPAQIRHMIRHHRSHNPPPQSSFRQSQMSPNNNMHVMDGGRLVDPSTDKDPTHWKVENDPPPDVDAVFFQNPEIQYFSYDPPKGFTAEEIMMFDGAGECLTLERVHELISLREKHGTLDRRGDDRWKV